MKITRCPAGNAAGAYFQSFAHDRTLNNSRDSEPSFRPYARDEDVPTPPIAQITSHLRNQFNESIRSGRKTCQLLRLYIVD